MRRRHLVIYRRRHGGRYVLRCFDCRFAAEVPDHDAARALIATHQAGGPE